MSITNKQKTGKLGENIAVKYLKNKGFTIVCRNYRCKFGEIDIVAEKGSEIIFIEVKTRKKVLQNIFGTPEEAVDKKKINKIIQSANIFLESFKYSLDIKWQIDIIAIELDWKIRKANLKHIKNATIL